MFCADAWQHVFSRPSQLPHMQVLDLGACNLQPNGISCLISSCPGLQSLQFANRPDNSPQLHVLTQLTSITELRVGSISWAAFQTLTALTQLRSLGVFVNCVTQFGVGVTGALKVLAALTELTRLDCNTFSLPYGLSRHVLKVGAVFEF